MKGRIIFLFYFFARYHIEEVVFLYLAHLI